MVHEHLAELARAHGLDARLEVIDDKDPAAVLSRSGTGA